MFGRMGESSMRMPNLPKELPGYGNLMGSPSEQGPRTWYVFISCHSYIPPMFSARYQDRIVNLSHTIRSDRTH